MKRRAPTLLASIATIGFTATAFAIPPQGSGTTSANMRAVEAARDRGAGRIVDQQTYELDRARAEQVGVPQFDLLMADRDRQLRIEDQLRQEQGDRAAISPDVFAPLNHPPREPSIMNAIIGSDMTLFTMQTDNELAALDRQTQARLAAARTKYSRDLLDAEAEPSPDIRRAKRAEVQKRFQETQKRIEESSQRRRMEILGWPTTQTSAISTTHPTTRP